MKLLRTVRITLLALVALLVACDTTHPGFTLSLNPASLSLQQGESKTVSVTAMSKDGFKGAIAVTLESNVLSASALMLAEGSSTGTLTVTAKADATLGVSTAKITGSSGKLTSSSNLSLTVAKKIFTITDTLPNYSAGNADIKAQLIVPNALRYVIGQGVVKADGTFTLPLQDVPAQYVDVPELGLTECSNIIPTPNTFKSVGLIEIELTQNGTVLGYLFRASRVEVLEYIFSPTPTGVPGQITLWVYSDAKVDVKGACSALDPRYNLPMTLDLALEKGWNTVMIDITDTTLTLTTSVSELPWFVGGI